MLALLNNLTLTVRMTGHALAYFGRGRWRRSTSPWPSTACRVPADFFGLCVANAPDPASDDYVIARLNELGILHARLDFTYGDRDAFTERFLDRLLTDRFRVCLHLVQPLEEAREMLHNPEAAERWRTFVGDMLNRYGSRVELIEIGSTCNRRKWAGYSPAAFFNAWQIAWEEARGRNLAIAGPNVTDFEPLYNAGWLGEFRRAGILPGVHTDNLFVERATEPEAFDHKIAGQRLAGLFRFNLVRKAQLLQDIGAWAGAPTFMSMHVAWSLRRIARFLEDVEEKQADYLARYACLAAASGALARVYWGPLIGQREGLIDDGTSEYPEIPHVTYYEQARGAIKDYRLRPAFRTFQTVNRLLAGAMFRQRLATGKGLEMLEFEQNQRSEVRGQRSDDEMQKEKQTLNAPTSPRSGASGHLAADVERSTSNAQCSKSDLSTKLKAGANDGDQATDDGDRNQQSEIRNPQSEAAPRLLHAVWTTDGNGVSVDACYPPEILAQAEIYDRDGRRLERPPRMFSESPVFLMWKDWEPEVRGQRSEISLLNRESSALYDQTSNCSLQSTVYSLQPSCIPGFRFVRKPGWDFDVLRSKANESGLGGVYLAGDGRERLDIKALIDLLRKSNAEIRDQRSEVSDHAADNGIGTDRQTSNAECKTADYGRQIADDGNLQSKIENRKPARNAAHSVAGGSKILRAARNYVWSVNAPWNAEKTIVIKEFRPRSVIRRILDYGKPNKAQRSWNGAQELLRRGLATPTPLACLMPGKGEMARHEVAPYVGPQLAEAIGNDVPHDIKEAPAASYYICESFAPAWSVRDVFTAFSAGATEYKGVSANEWYEAIAVFLQKLHTRGVYFRDLSAGNLLVRISSGLDHSTLSPATAGLGVCCSSPIPPPVLSDPASGIRRPASELEFSLIDTARARFYPHSLGLRTRLCDLMRICHPLSWPGRNIFVEKYLAHNGRRFNWWMKIPFRFYDGKHRLKNALKKIWL